MPDTARETDFNQWLAEVKLALSSSEHGETFDNLLNLLGSGTNARFGLTQAEGSLPSDSLLGQLYQSGRLRRIRFFPESTIKLEENILALLQRLGEENASIAEPYAKEILILAGNIAPDLAAHIREMIYRWDHAQPAPALPEHRHPGGTYPTHKTNAPEPQSHRPAQDPRRRVERAIADATQAFDAAHGGDADAGP